ncbi:MAG: alpha/beta hydrolase-fold protein [Bacteroidales bacterium]
MKKFFIPLLMLVLCHTLPAQNMVKIDTTMYSTSLGKDVELRIYLPYGYDTSGLHYPVIYYLHPWGENQASVTIGVAGQCNQMIKNGVIEPVILVCANNYVLPFRGSCYANSSLYGNYEDFMVDDFIDWMDESFRTVAARSHRALLGLSMGATGSLNLGLRYPAKYCALASQSPTLNLTVFRDTMGYRVKGENAGPPYSYTFTFNLSSYPFTCLGFLAAGASCPNPNTPQTYINPAIVEFPFDENGDAIDSIWWKIRTQLDPVVSALNFSHPDTPAIFFSAGTNDGWLLYQPTVAFCDTLDALGFRYEFMSYVGGHVPPVNVDQRAFVFLDSILGSPVMGIEQASGYTKVTHLSCYPNPLQDEGMVTFGLRGAAPVEISVSDLSGRKVAVVTRGDYPAGTHQVRWNAHGIARGAYLLRLESGSQVMVRKIVRL